MVTLVVTILKYLREQGVADWNINVENFRGKCEESKLQALEGEVKLIKYQVSYAEN